MTVGTRAEKVLQWPGLRGMAALGLVGLALLTGCATSSGTGFAQSQEEAATAAAVARLPAIRRSGSVAVIPQAGVALPMPGTGNDEQLTGSNDAALQPSLHSAL